MYHYWFLNKVRVSVSVPSISRVPDSQTDFFFCVCDTEYAVPVLKNKIINFEFLKFEILF